MLSWQYGLMMHFGKISCDDSDIHLTVPVNQAKNQFRSSFSLVVSLGEWIKGREETKVLVGSCSICAELEFCINTDVLHF